MPEWLPSWAGVRPWHWWILGAGLLLLELALPGVVFVWLALAAFALGLIVFVLPLSVPLQLLLFALGSVVSVYFGRRYVSRLPSGADREGLNERGQRYVGRQLTVESAIVDGQGKVRVGDGVWLASGPDAPRGATVRVVGARGTVLLVEPIRD